MTIGLEGSQVAKCENKMLSSKCGEHWKGFIVSYNFESKLFPHGAQYWRVQKVGKKFQYWLCLEYPKILHCYIVNI